MTASTQEPQRGEHPKAQLPRRSELVVSWLAFRVFTALLATLASSLRPITALEKTVDLWPPSPPLWRWGQRAFLAPWMRWDTVHYVSIVESGYSVDDGRAAFQPLFPWLAAPPAWLVRDPLLALLLVSSAAAILFLFAFEKLACLDLSPAAARSASMVLLFSPLAFVLFVPYTESLFLLFAVLCFYCARTGRWARGALCGSLATLTRQQGIFLCLPIFWELWEASGRRWRNLAASWSQLLAACSIPMSALGWGLFRGLIISDIDWKAGPVSVAMSLLVSPAATKVVPTQEFTWPWRALSLAARQFISAPNADTIIDLTFGIAFIGLATIALPRIRMSYGIYTIAILAISFSYYTGPPHPYMGLPRHLFLAFPLFLGVGKLLSGSRWQLVVLGMGGLGIFFLTLLYTINGWVP